MPILSVHRFELLSILIVIVVLLLSFGAVQRKVLVTLGRQPLVIPTMRMSTNGASLDQQCPALALEDY